MSVRSHAIWCVIGSFCVVATMSDKFIIKKSYTNLVALNEPSELLVAEIAVRRRLQRLELVVLLQIQN